jgi:SPP1 gp7 family putative phage head morphogenesis protein
VSARELQGDLETEFRQHGVPLRFGTIRGRASVIARDQLGTLNSRLTRARHELVGVARYRWVTMGDDLVRDEHAERNGQEFEWDDPPPDGHPGEPINCRCHARAAIRAEDLRISPRIVEAA